MNVYLDENDLKVNRGTIVDATIINAPSSTKNKKKQRDPEIHQTRKGNQWYFGMKAYIGVDSKTKLIHSVAVTPANVHDSQVLADLLHGDEIRVWGDSAYASQKATLKDHASQAKDFTQKKGSLSPVNRCRTISQPPQIENTIQSGAYLWGDEAAVWF